MTLERTPLPGVRYAVRSSASSLDLPNTLIHIATHASSHPRRVALTASSNQIVSAIGTQIYHESCRYRVLDYSRT